MTLAIFNGLAALNTGGDILVLASPSIEVREESGGTLVSLFEDRAGSSGISNPFTGNADGSFSFYVAGDRYHITATLGGDTVEWRNVPIGLLQEHDSVSDAELDSNAVTEAKIAAAAVSQSKLESALSTLLLWPRIRGLVPANDGTDATNDIAISAGVAISAAGVIGPLSSTFVKKADATFAKGTAAGGMYSGGTWGADDWHLWLIREDATGDGDIYIDDDVDGANCPADWTLIKRVVSFRTTSAAWPVFRAREIAGGGLRVKRDVPVRDYTATNPGTSPVTVTLTVPGDIEVDSILYAVLQDNTPDAVTNMHVYEAWQTATAASGTVMNLSLVASGAGVPTRNGSYMNIRTDTLRTFRFDLDASTADHGVDFINHGWVDNRI